VFGAAVFVAAAFVGAALITAPIFGLFAPGAVGKFAAFAPLFVFAAAGDVTPAFGCASNESAAAENSDTCVT